MKLINIPSDAKLHTYCIKCQRESVRSRRRRGLLRYRCGDCGHDAARALIVDPAVKWWLGGDGEYWHETAGVFVKNEKSEFLFFRRTKFPFGLTVPAGHVDAGEAHLKTARRELFEETGLRVPQTAFTHVATANIHGDSCRRGSDTHRWQIYATRLPPRAAVKVNADEGTHPTWLRLDEALKHGLTFATRYAISRYGRDIVRVR